MDSTSATRALRKQRRDELGAFLKSRRARIAPADVGLPPGPRRRTPGLRREEVAQLSGIGITWYTWLEQGRAINVSVQVLDALARTLELDPTEHAHLYRLADVPAAPGPIEDGTLPDELQVILDQLAPLPAAVFGPMYDLLAHNWAYEELFPALLQSEQRNLLWQVFTSPVCCAPFEPNPEDRARMVAYLRAGYGKHVGDPVWLAFIGKLCDISPQFAALWSRNDVATPGSKERTVQHLAVGNLAMMLTSMTLPAPAGVWIQILTARDDPTTARLQQLHAMTPEQRQAPWLEHNRRYHAG